MVVPQGKYNYSEVAKAVLLPIQRLDPIPPPSEEQKQRVCEGVKIEFALYHSGQAVDPFSQIRVAAGNVNTVCAGEVI